MSEVMTDVVQELDVWIVQLPELPASAALLRRARDEIVALRGQVSGINKAEWRIRADALEEAAKVAEAFGRDVIAAAIRALKEQRDE